MEIIFETQEFFSYSLELQRLLARETKNEDLINEILKSESEKVLLSLSENNALTKEHIKILAKVDNHIITRNMAKNIKASEDTLDELSKSKYEATVQAVAENPSTSRETLNDLIERNRKLTQRCETIMYSIRKNPSASKEIRRKAREVLDAYYSEMERKYKLFKQKSEKD